MMSVKEYAEDINMSVDEVIALCKKLGLEKSGDDMLSEDDIVLLDNNLDNEEDLDETIEEDIIDEEIEEDLKIDVVQDKSEVKMKKQPKKNVKTETAKFLKEKKKMYTDKEKFTEEKSNDEKVVLYKEGMSVKDLADQLNVNSKEIITKLFNLGLMVNINQSLDFSTIEMILVDYDMELKREETRDISNFEEYEIIDKEEDLTTRPPIVTIMGHVDHGKTSLLDCIREANVVEGEAGGITQHIGAYQVKTHDKLITFIDTPGHAAFTEMRSRGAAVTDIVIIIVSAEDGVKPQTKEAIDHAKAAGVPIIVAINKMDLPNANPDKVLTELSEYGLTPEEWGGDVLVNKISCKTKEGIDDLLENILLIADMNDYKVNPNRYASGTVIESRLDKSKGVVSTLLIQNGTLRLGDPVVIGNFYGKIRTLKNDLGESIAKALPSAPVEITGISDMPFAGDLFMAFETEKQARKISEERIQRSKELDTNRAGMSLEELFNKVQLGVKKIEIVLKTDVKGSEEAIKQALSKMDIEGVKVNVIRSGVGTITESDILLADASDAIIIGFNVRVNKSIEDLAKEHNVDVRFYQVIYKITEDIEKAIIGMLDPEYEEKILGSAEVRQLFKFSKVGIIAGCFVQDGIINQNNKARLIRDGIVIYDGQISSIQKGKDKVVEIKKGLECGITLENFSDIKEGDIIEAYKMEEIKR